MKLIINREKYINNQCPRISKELMDVYYDNLFKVFQTIVNPLPFNIINTINIRINQAYNGCSIIHFYTSINGLPEIHQEYYITDKVDYYPNKRLWTRVELILNYEKTFKISFGKHKLQEKIDNINFIIKQKKETLQRVKNLKYKYNKYIELNKYFNY